MRKKIRLKKIIPFLLSALWVIFALWVLLAPKTLGTSSDLIHNFFKGIDFLVYDIRQQATLHVRHSTSYPIVMVVIDDKSIQQEGQWPWSYYKIATLISRLRAQGALVIASDIIFATAEKNIISIVKHALLKTRADNSKLIHALDKLEPAFDTDARLMQQIQDKQDIVLPFLLFRTDYRQGILPKPLAIFNLQDLHKVSIMNMPGYITNFAALQSVSEHNGFISILTDEDGVIRRTPLVLRYQNRVYRSLPLAVAEILLTTAPTQLNMVDIRGKKYLKSIRLGTRNIPTDEAGRVFIPFQGKAHSFKSYSATDILQNRLKPDELKQAIVFIGTSAAGFSSFSSTSVDDAMPNIEIHANVLAGILDNHFPHLIFGSKVITFGLTLILGILLTLLLPSLSPALSILLALSVLILLLAANISLWIAWGIVLSFSVPVVMTIMLVITNMAYGFLFESRKKKFLQDVFSQYVAADHVKLLVDNPDEYSLEGNSLELTVLFADIRHFTTISEGLAATDIKKLLNGYFTPMTEIIFNHGGTIDKYVGDMIMAFWGAPIKNVQQREAAIDAALDMIAKSEELKAGFRASGLPEVNIGIGINTGQMNVGDMGSTFRRSYTVLGDSVNLGSRLESATKYYGVKLIVGNETRAGQTQYVFRLLDKVKVKGKHHAELVYEVVCRMTEATPALLQDIETHEKAMTAYFMMDWALVRTLFKSLADKYPDALIYKLLLERITDFEQNPPPADWDGSYARQEK